MKFPDSDFDSLPHFHDKMSVQIIMETSGPHSEIPTSLAEIVTDRNGDPHGSSLTQANTHGI